MLKTITPIITTGLFAVLASFSYGKCGAATNHNALYAVNNHNAHYAKAKPVIIHRINKATIIADIWNIKPNELKHPINIFAEE